MTVISVLALLAWVTVLARGAWLVAHPRRQPVPALGRQVRDEEEDRHPPPGAVKRDEGGERADRQGKGVESKQGSWAGKHQ